MGWWRRIGVLGDMYPTARCLECIARFLVLVPDTVIWELCRVRELGKNDLALCD